MKYCICFIAVLLLPAGCKDDRPNSKPTPDRYEQEGKRDKIAVDGNESGHRFELLAAENAEEVSEGVFLVGWIRVSSGEEDFELQTIAVEMDEPYVHWVQWGLEKQDINFDGYTDIGVHRHGGAKWGKLFWWLYDPEKKRYYRNWLTEEISKLTHASFRTESETRQIKITKFLGAEIREYTYRIVEGELRQVNLRIIN
jgi:hypothetical protein